MFNNYLLFLAFLMISVCSFAAGKQQKISVTEVNTFYPIGSHIYVRRGFCWTNSIATNRSDAWRCMVNNEIHDPCFVLKPKGDLICDADPMQDKVGFLLNLTKPLPKRKEIKSSKADAWVIELDNGQVCRPYTGTMPVIRKGHSVIALKYGCQVPDNDETSGLLNGSIIPGKVWRAKKVVYKVNGHAPKIIKIQSIKIKKVWK